MLPPLREIINRWTGRSDSSIERAATMGQTLYATTDEARAIVRLAEVAQSVPYGETIADHIVHDDHHLSGVPCIGCWLEKSLELLADIAHPVVMPEGRPRGSGAL
jgi:hypothetical protein